MPVKSETTTTTTTLLNMECPFGLSNLDVDDLYTASESLLSDDIWKKFELEIPDLLDFDDLLGGLDSKRQPDQREVIRNHDCMWAGHCVSKEHPAEEKLRRERQQLQQQAAEKAVKQQQQQQQVVQPGRSLLLKTVVKAPPPPPPPPVPGPDSPPMSDDEENKTM